MTTKQYMMPISADEYEKQKLDYTQQALKDLQNHLEEHVNKNIKNINNTNYKMKKNNSNNSNDWNDSNDSDKNNSVVEYTTDDNEDIDNVNITINREPKKYKTRSNSNKAKKNNPNIILSPGDIERYINQSMVHEYEVTIGKYKSSISALRNEINEENKKTHYLKLDLNNAICDNNDNKNKVMQLKAELLDKNKLITIQNDTLYKNKMHILALKIILYIQMVIIFFLWIF
jgi:hypothetical protein